jgi:hypothetical protein
MWKIAAMQLAAGKLGSQWARNGGVRLRGGEGERTADITIKVKED